MSEPTTNTATNDKLYNSQHSKVLSESLNGDAKTVSEDHEEPTKTKLSVDDKSDNLSNTSPTQESPATDAQTAEPQATVARFREFTKESYDRLLEKELERKLKVNVQKEGDSEGRLVDGEIVFDDVEEASAKSIKDPKLADGQPLPEKLGRFPKELDGVPIEELDPAIEDKVCS